MFKKILIANRGEIAIRIIRACHEMNIETVAIYSKEDRDSLHRKLATDSICIGEGKSSNTYLNMANILNVAILTKCDAIHPGYGFLSENDEFVDLVEKCNIKFIGPKKETIRLMGNKSMSRKLMIENNIPVVPGSKDNITDVNKLKIDSRKIGYPVLLKASSGGGGKGMRIVESEEDLESKLLSAKSEAKSSFGDDEMYLEKYIKNPRHIEFQILADEYNNIIHLGERDCSIQRRNQKILEESPSPRLSDELRNKMGEYAIKAAKASDYVNAGTIEFILDDDDNFYFIEMNTRLQVEHTITEMVSGIDIVKEQIKIAARMKLDYSQEDINLNGHSIECRINAEDILNDFAPNTGTVIMENIPNGYNIRFDSYMQNNYQLSPLYDSMIGKLIVKDVNRNSAIKKMRSALEEMKISGIKTNIDLHYGILHDFDFIRGRYNTGFLEEKLKGDFKEFLNENGEIIL